MRVGSLNKVIDLEAQSKVPDGMGSFTTTWTAVASGIHAAIWPVSATENIRGAAPTMTVSHRIRIRYRSVLKPSWRVSWAGRYFYINSIIDPNERHKYIDILCKESV